MHCLLSGDIRLPSQRRQESVGCDSSRQIGERCWQKALTVAVIPKGTSGEFWQTVEVGAKSAAKDLGVSMRWEGAQVETESAEESKIMENMVNLGVDGIAMAPIDAKALRKPVENAVAAGIPVVIFDSAVDGDAHTSFVATDNVAGGALGAKHLIDKLGERREARDHPSLHSNRQHRESGQRVLGCRARCEF